MTTKIPLILFSGGLDSTALLYKQLQNGPCDVMYADGGQHPGKIASELVAREKIINYLNATCPHKVQQDFRAPHISFAQSPGNRYSQPAAWLFAALSVIDGTRHSELRVGYVYDDGGFCRWLPNIENAWRELQRFSRWHDPIPVVWPLIDWEKYQLLDVIDPELVNMIWVCEQPKHENDNKFSQCGSCRPCKTAKQALANYKEDHGYTIHTKLLINRQRRAENAKDRAKTDSDFVGKAAAVGHPVVQVRENMPPTIHNPRPNWWFTSSTDVVEK